MPRSKGTFAQTVGLLRGWWATYTAATVIAAGEAAAMLAFPLVQRAFYDQVLVAGETDVLTPVLAAMFGLVAVMIGTKTVAKYLFVSVTERAVVSIRSQLAERAYSRPLGGDREATGEMVSVATNDVATMGELYKSVLGQGVVHALRLVGTLVVLAAIDRRLLLVALPLLGLYAIVPLRVAGGLREAGESVQERTGRLVSTLQEGFSGLRDIKAFGRAGWAVARQRDAGDALREAELRRTRLELLSMGSFVTYWLSVIGISWYGAIAVSEGRLTVGSLLALLLYFGHLQQPVSFLVSLNNRLQGSLAAAKRVFAHLDEPVSDEQGAERSHEADTPGPRRQAAPGALEVRGLSFRYPGGGGQLSDVSVHVGAGEFVAVVGETGSGKTTLVNAVLGLVEADAGEVLLDGRRLADLPDEDLRRRVSVSSSDAVLFDLPVAENIRFGKLSATDEEVRRAAWLSAADDFIEALPHGYDTTVGERGDRLSTGQRQRVALARALIRQPSVLLLDEATSGLDGPTERLVMQRLLSEPDRPSILMVTHRLHALRQADRIYVLDEGRVVEEGDHWALLREGGVYHGLCERQGLATAPALVTLGGDGVGGSRGPRDQPIG